MKNALAVRLFQVQTSGRHAPGSGLAGGPRHPGGPGRPPVAAQPARERSYACCRGGAGSRASLGRGYGRYAAEWDGRSIVDRAGLGVAWAWAQRGLSVGLGYAEADRLGRVRGLVVGVGVAQARAQALGSGVGDVAKVSGAAEPPPVVGCRGSAASRASLGRS